MFFSLLLLQYTITDNHMKQQTYPASEILLKIIYLVSSIPFSSIYISN